MSRPSTFPSQRRSFLTRLNAGVASLAAIAAGGVAMAKAKPSATPRWEPARHDKDDWLDKLPGKHRLIFDTTTPEGLRDALLFANNFMNINRSDYGLENGDLAVVIVARHRSTPFGYNDAMWAKYGMEMGVRAKVEDPATKAAPKRNIYYTGDHGDTPANRGTTLDSLFKQWVQLAVCATATRGLSRLIAEAVGGNADAIYNELTANLVSNARMVPAGIVAVNRAQERGYSLVST
jgi:intracellular sulfur oxidation DsrE/DsrF family protein